MEDNIPKHKSSSSTVYGVQCSTTCPELWIGLWTMAQYMTDTTGRPQNFIVIEKIKNSNGLRCDIFSTNKSNSKQQSQFAAHGW